MVSRVKIIWLNLEKAVIFVRKILSPNVGCKEQPFVLEFVGPSGIGKSTLANVLQKEIGGKLISRVELISRKNTPKLARPFFEDLLKEKTKNLSIAPINSERLNLLAKYYQKVLDTEVKIPFIKKSKLVVLDEGIVHNFAPELLNTNWKNKEFRAILNRRLICFCSASEEFVSKNLQKRRKQDRLDENKILQNKEYQIKEQFKIMESLQQKFQESDYAFICIDLEKYPLEENAGRIKEAFNNFISATK